MGPESTPVSAAQEAWVMHTFPQLECVFAGAWRIADQPTWQAIAETLQRLDGGPPVQARLRLLELRDRPTEPPGRDAQGVPSWYPHADVADLVRDTARQHDLRDFDDLIAAVPDWPDAWLLRAERRARAHDDYAGAARDAEHAAALDPACASAWFALACARQSLGDLAAAEVALRTAVGLQPQNRTWLEALGFLLARAGHHGPAIAMLLRAAPRRPAHQSTLYYAAHLQRGRSHAALGETEAAIAAFADASRAFADTCIPMLETARLLWSAGAPPRKVLAAADKAIALAKEDEHEPWVLRGGILRWLGRYPQALADLDVALAHCPSDVAARGERGVVLAELGRADQALADLDAYLAVAVWQPALLARARLRLQRGDRDAAAADIGAILRDQPDDPTALALQAEMRLAGGDDPAQVL